MRDRTTLSHTAAAPALPRAALFVFALLGVLMSLPGQTAGISPFTDYLIGALQMSRAHLSIAYLIGTILSAFVLTPAGRAYDRLGSRVTGTAVSGALGLSLVALTFSPRIAAGVSAAGLPSAAAALVVMSFAFFLVRFFGQGMMQLVDRTMIMKWFDDKRGFANAILSSMLPLVFGLAPLVLNTVISAYGWQGAWLILAVILLPGFTVIAALTFADPPVDYHRQHVQATDGAPQVPRALRPAALRSGCSSW